MEDRYRIKASDYEKQKESIPTKEQTSISPYAISRAELEAASKVFASKTRLPSFALPTFHFSNKASELNETSKPVEEANMGGPMFTWNKDSKAFHNPDPHKRETARKDKAGIRYGESKYDATAVDKEIKKDKRISGKEAKKIHAVLKGWRGK